MLLYPMFAMVILTFFVTMIMFRRRVKAMRSGQMDYKYLRTMTGGNPPEEAVVAARHYSNLFELPVLFYAGCITAMVLHFTGIWPQIWAWLFVLARVVHAAIHLGKNRVQKRALAFSLGWVAVLGLWIQLTLTYAFLDL